MKPTSVFHGRAHHEERDCDADGDEDLDQFWHPAVGLVLFPDDLQSDRERQRDRDGEWDSERQSRMET